MCVFSKTHHRENTSFYKIKPGQQLRPNARIIRIARMGCADHAELNNRSYSRLEARSLVATLGYATIAHILIAEIPDLLLVIEK